MTDRELLELAAKAAGYKKYYANYLGRLSFVSYEDTYYNPEKECLVTGIKNRDWNPLTDDGDALRLLVKLSQPDSGVTLMLNSRFGSSGFAQCITNDRVIAPDEFMGDDPCAATRRAIVRAAAAIGASS